MHSRLPRIHSMPFVSACSMRIASSTESYRFCKSYLCLSVLHADCILIVPSEFHCLATLSQRAPCGLHRRPTRVWRGRGKALSQRAPCGLHPRLVYTKGVVRESLSQRAPCGLHPGQRASGAAGAKLCLSVLHADCISLSVVTDSLAMPLSQRAPCGLHQQKCTNEHKICCGIRCEQVDSFSVMRN